MRPNVAFGASSAPNVAFGASDATNATLGRLSRGAVNEPRTRDHAITKIFPRIAETGTAKDVLAATS
ncbi:hypothetical protein H4696_003086 [Amycolatopsis lexingtonensis]|uniref:FXSXX-COOH protein n=1 Tax=Amycolatopsis lexingtonensis TaxID=218822 RepID=A0ABR9HYJ1_9PSEU|nr:hypothetical protein [Amycolatopsis lexingtonensis]MBE1495986.1 hypothetical protein [Amycolatopsis lexingtonensis]